VILTMQHGTLRVCILCLILNRYLFDYMLPVLRQVIPIIDIPGFGTAAAEKVCLDMKIQSQVRAKGHGEGGRQQ